MPINLSKIPINVSIVEDDNGVRESLAALINGTRGFRCLGAYPSAEKALKHVRGNWPDVLLMDINLPRMSGLECLAKLKAIRPSLQILILTVCDDSKEIFDALMAGASGYLIKDTSPSEILEAISDLQAGGAPMSGPIARKVVQYFQSRGLTHDVAEDLSKREVEVLTYLSEGYRYKEIADRLSISILTVRSHLQRIYEKLHVRSRTEAVVKFLKSKHSI